MALLSEGWPAHGPARAACARLLPASAARWRPGPITDYPDIEDAKLMLGAAARLFYCVRGVASE